MRNFKKLACIMLAASLTVGGAITSYAGQWIFDGPEDWQWWYQNDDGSYPMSNWQEIDGKWYHFDADGYMDVGQWIEQEEIETFTSDYGEDYSYPVKKWYWVDENGVMATSGSWEGGHITSDGSLMINSVGVVDGELLYYDGEAASISYGTLEWKKQLGQNWEKAIGGRDDVGTYSLDFQLPSNWHEQCPKPLISALIDYICAGSWAGETSRWNYSWNVDDNYVIHITAEFQGY